MAYRERDAGWSGRGWDGGEGADGFEEALLLQLGDTDLLALVGREHVLGVSDATVCPLEAAFEQIGTELVESGGTAELVSEDWCTLGGDVVDPAQGGREEG
jgi:hypothetical protein